MGDGQKANNKPNFTPFNEIKIEDLNALTWLFGNREVWPRHVVCHKDHHASCLTNHSLQIQLKTGIFV